MIACVVLGHAIDIIPESSGWRDGGGWSALYSAIYLFHMPVFVFISGYLSSSKPITELARGILFTYVVAQVAYFVFNVALSPFGAPLVGIMTVINLGMYPGYGLWYLLSLFLWRSAIPLLTSSRYPLLMLLLLCGYAACIGTTRLDGTLSLSRTFTFLPFFAAGYWSKLNGWKITESPFRLPDVGVGVLALGTSVFLTGYAYRNSLLLLHLNFPFHMTETHISAGCLFRLGMFLADFGIIRLLFLIVPSSPTLFTRCGARSLSIYLGHLYVLYLLRILLPGSIWTSQLWWLAPLFTVSSCAVFAYFDVERILQRLRPTR